MASIGATRLNTFQKVRRYLQYQAHENPAIFWSVLVGASGPVLLATVPPIRRKYFGYVPPDPIPMSYPLPQRSRDRDLKGYDD